MTIADPAANRTTDPCKVCGASSVLFGAMEVLKQYRVRYFRCSQCGFIQTEEPHWLEEAYSSAIARQDVGIMRRNLINCEVTSAVLLLLFPRASRAVDFGAGHGVLVRLMRDRGFDFSWYDLHATNDYARGFEWQEGSRFEFSTAFEVLEHLVNPIPDLTRLMTLADNVLISTCTVPEPVPGLTEWWYFMPSSGQHISFYTVDALQRIAACFGRHLLSSGSFHLFSREPKSELLFRAATNFRMAKLVNAAFKRPTLIDQDFQRMTR